MKRIVTFWTLVITAIQVYCAITVAVPVQLYQAEHDQLPDKTIECTLKALKFKDNAPQQLISAIDSAINIVTENASMWRTYKLEISPDGTSISITDIDPFIDATTPKSMMGSVVSKHFHFLVYCTEGNKNLINKIFSRTSEKINYVREYEFVEVKIDPFITRVEIDCSGATPKVIKRVVENIDLDSDQ